MKHEACSRSPESVFYECYTTKGRIATPGHVKEPILSIALAVPILTAANDICNNQGQVGRENTVSRSVPLACPLA